MRRAAVILIKLSLIALLVVYMARQILGGGVDLTRLKALSGGWGWLALAQALVLATLSVTFLRFQLLLRAQGIVYALREIFALGFVGFLFNQFIPGSTGGDLIKAYYVAVDHPERRAAGVTTVFLDRVVGVLALVAMCAGAVALNWGDISRQPILRSVSLTILAFLAGAVVGGAVFFSERVRAHPVVRAASRWLPFRDLLMKVQGAVYLYKFHPWLVALVLALSVGVQFTLVGQAMCFAQALGGGADLASFFFIVPLGHLAMAIPTGSPGGLGQSELAFQELFKLAGYPHGLLLALLQRVNWSLWGLLGCIPYLRRKQRVQRARELAESAARGPGWGS